MGCAGNVTRVGEMRKYSKLRSRRPRGRDYFEDQRIKGKVKLKYNLMFRVGDGGLD
jgi:hypothetical protein